MSNWLNNFMVGKKKYSASVILPIVIAIIQVMTADSDKAQTLIALAQEFLPTLIALVGGVSYTIMEGINDNAKIKNSNGSAVVNGLVSGQTTQPAQVTNGQAAEPAAATTVSPSVQIQTPAPTWNVKAFDDKVKQKAAQTYGVLNPSTELFQALAEGQATKCDFIEHAVVFWDYALMKADARFADIWGYNFAEATEKVTEPGCPKAPTACGSFSILKHKALALGEQFYTAYLDYDRILGKSRDVQILANYVTYEGFDWKGRLASVHQNLYFVGERASDLLRYV